MHELSFSIMLSTKHIPHDFHIQLRCAHFPYCVFQRDGRVSMLCVSSVGSILQIGASRGTLSE